MIALKIAGSALMRGVFAAALALAPVPLVIEEEAAVTLLVDRRWARWLEHDAPSGADLRALVLVTDGEPDELAQAVRLGIQVFSGTGDGLESLFAAVHAAAERTPYCSDSLFLMMLQVTRGGMAAGQEASGRAALCARLSPAEVRVAIRAARGLTNPQIARGLSISIPTVKTHLGHAFDKLRIERRIGLTDFLAELTNRERLILSDDPTA